MPGWRIGFAAGNKTLIHALSRIKSYLDYGAFTPIQVAASAALNGPQDCVDEIRRLYKDRRDVLIDGLEAAGWSVPSPPATMFAWAPIPPAFAHLGSLEFSKLLLREAKVAVAPGIGFGEHGDTHVRIALVENRHRIRQAVRSIKQFLRRSGQSAGKGGKDGKAESVGGVMDGLKIAMAGLGTVGGGTVRLIHQQADLLTARDRPPLATRRLRQP